MNKMSGRLSGTQEALARRLEKGRHIGRKYFRERDKRVRSLMGMWSRWVFTVENRGVCIDQDTRHFKTTASGNAIRSQGANRRIKLTSLKLFKTQSLK